MMARLSALLSSSVLLLSACAATPDTGPLEVSVTNAADEVIAGRLQIGVDQLEDLFPSTLGLPSEELRVEYYLTQAHLAASIRAPFLDEPTSGSTRTVGGGESRRPSPTAHLVALVYHASAARALMDQNEGGLDRDLVEGNLRLATSTTLARLGFHDVARRAAEGDPELLELDSFQSVLERYDLPSELATWLAVMAFDAHKTSDELTAYRFAILAIEGKSRFGHALTPLEIVRLEDWIMNRASVRFVCPESGTPYVTGTRRSPRSGIPHDEYVPSPRDQ